MCLCVRSSLPAHAQGDLASFSVASRSLKNSPTTGVVHRGLLAEERLRAREPEHNVLAQTTWPLAIFMQCFGFGGRLKGVPLCLAGLF